MSTGERGRQPKLAFSTLAFPTAPLTDVVAFGLKSLDRILAEAWSPALGVLHVVAYGEGKASEEKAGKKP